MTVNGISNAVQVYTTSAGSSTNYGRSCAVLADKTVKCWGYLSGLSQATPIAIVSLTDVVDFSMSQGNNG